MNREPVSPNNNSNAAPRAPRRWRSSSLGNELLGHTPEDRAVTKAPPCRTRSSDELEEDLMTPLPHQQQSSNNPAASDDDDVSMQDAEMEICNDAASVGSFSHCSEGGGRPSVVATDSCMSLSRLLRRHVSATDSCLSVFSTDSLQNVRFIAPSNSFTPQDIIMMEDEERISALRSSSFRMSFGSEGDGGDKKKAALLVDHTPNHKQQPALWKSLPFATNQGLPDLHSSAVSYEEGEANNTSSSSSRRDRLPPLRKPPVQRKSSIYRAPTTTAGVASASS